MKSEHNCYAIKRKFFPFQYFFPSRFFDDAMKSAIWWNYCQDNGLYKKAIVCHQVDFSQFHSAAFFFDRRILQWDYVLIEIFVGKKSEVMMMSRRWRWLDFFLRWNYAKIGWVKNPGNIFGYFSSQVQENKNFYPKDKKNFENPGKPQKHFFHEKFLNSKKFTSFSNSRKTN